MSALGKEGDTLVTREYNGLGCTPYDLQEAGLMDSEGYYDVTIYFPQDEWDACTNEDDQLELINDYTFHDWCILDASWEEVEDDNAAPGEVAIQARIQPDLDD